MKKQLPLLLLMLLFIFTVSLKASNPFTDTLQPQKTLLPLKERALTTETLIATGYLEKCKKLNKQQLAMLSVNEMDQSFDPDLQYRLIDTLYQGKDHYVLLLGQWYDFENKAWVASYAAPNKLIDYRQVFYDNGEGFLSVETVIKNNMLTITTHNEYEEGAAKKKVEKYSFGTTYKLQKL